MTTPKEMSQQKQEQSEQGKKQKEEGLKQSIEAQKRISEKASSKASANESVEKGSKDSVESKGLDIGEKVSLLDVKNDDDLNMTLKTIKALEKKAQKESTSKQESPGENVKPNVDADKWTKGWEGVLSDESLEGWAESVKGEINNVIKWAKRYRPEESSTPKASGKGLSASERRERLRVAKPVDGLGFAFGEDKPAKGEWDRWYSGLSAADKVALKHPNCVVYIKMSRSRAGKESVNVDLSERSARNVEEGLVARGVKRTSIRTYWFGEDLAKFNGVPDGKDRAIDRIARIEIEIREPRGGETGTKSKQKEGVDRIGRNIADIGRKVGEAGAAPEKPNRQSISKELRDLIDDVHIDTLLQVSENILSEIVGVAKTAVGYITKIGEANYELHRGNVQSLRRWGLNYGTLILQRDANQTDNVHIKLGKPYTGKELFQEIMNQGSIKRQIYDDQRTGGRINVAKANKVLRDSIDQVADLVNPLLKKGNTPVQRKAIMNVFVGLVQNRLKKSFEKSLSSDGHK